LVKVRFGCVELGKDRSWLVGIGNVRLGYVRFGKVRLGYYRIKQGKVTPRWISQA
jgi:hypothetical protein